MSQKLFKNYLTSQLFTKLINYSKTRTCQPNTLISSLERSKKVVPLNTGRFFKKITFLSLAINGLEDYRYRPLKLKSITNNLWNMIGAYNIIF